jgi:hypothetical protein
VGLELDALGADGEVGEPLLSRQRPASEGWCGTPPCSVSLGAAASAGDEEDVAVAVAVRARFGAIAERGKGITRERIALSKEVVGSAFT